MTRLLAGALLLAGWSTLSGVALAAPSKHAALIGSWNMDAAKSQVADGRDVSLTIDLAGDIMKFAMTAKKGGASTTSQFACDTGSGAECPFEEAGHKSKISVYFNGDVLNIWKSDGPAGDVSAQWKVEISPDGKVLTATVSHLEPAAKDEVLVFGK